MIEFCGEMSDKCKRYMLKRMGTVGFVSGLITAILFIIPLVFAAVYWNLIVLLFLPVLIALPWLGFVPPTKKDSGLIIPSKITIDLNENTITCESDKLHLIRYIENVRNVIDMGEWYTINFYYAYRDMHFVCEKRLLCQGSIEEFEKLFEGKISCDNR